MAPISTSWSIKGNGQTTFSKLRTIVSFISSTSDHSAPTDLSIKILLALADVLLDKLASCYQGVLRRDVKLYIWMAYLLLRLQAVRARYILEESYKAMSFFFCQKFLYIMCFLHSVNIGTKRARLNWDIN